MPTDTIAKLQSFRGVEGLSRLFLFKLDVVSQQLPEAFFKSIDAMLNWRIQIEKPRYFFGKINSIMHLGATPDGLQHYRLNVVPQEWALTQEIKSRTFVNQTVPEIVKEILQKAGISAFSFKSCREQYQPRDFVSQYFVPTWQFVERLLAEEGIFYYFTFEKNRYVLNFADNAQVYLPESPSAKKHITYWEEQYSLGAEQFVLQDYNYLTPDKVVEGEASAKNSGTVENKPKRTKIIFASHVMTDKAAKRKAELIAQSESQALNRVRVKSTFEHFAPLMKLKDKVVTKVFHCYDGSCRNKLYLVDVSPCFRPAQIQKPQTKGLDAAKVVGATKPVSTDKLARVQVNFSWQPDTKASKSLRISHWMAGKTWGTQFIPHIDDTVLVAYEYDDPDRPIIVGSLYQQNQALPLQTKIKTLKHEIKLLDKEALFYWHSGGDMEIHAGKTLTNTVKGDQKITVQEGDYNIKVENGSYIIKAKQAIQFQAGNSFIRLDPNEITLNSDLLRLN